MNYSHMDALLASDSKREFDLDGMLPGTLGGVIHEAHVLRLRAASLELSRVNLSPSLRGPRRVCIISVSSSNRSLNLKYRAIKREL